jgi:hypothetical protein
VPERSLVLARRPNGRNASRCRTPRVVIDHHADRIGTILAVAWNG